MGRIKRISIAIDEDLLKAIDDLMVRQGEVNRSRFISALLANAIASMYEEVKAKAVFSLIVLMYDHEVGEVDKTITEIQHVYRDVIRVTTHIHVTDRDCIEVIHAIGSYERIQDLVTRLSAIKRGVKFLRVINLPIPQELTPKTSPSPTPTSASSA